MSRNHQGPFFSRAAQRFLLRCKCLRAFLCLHPRKNMSPAIRASHNPRSPIKHVIVIIGENRSFDHVFATYKPRRRPTVDNLLSKGIINDGRHARPQLLACSSVLGGRHFGRRISGEPAGESHFYAALPPPLAGGPTIPFVSSLAEAKAVENGLPDDTYYTYLTTGGTGLTAGTPDTRIPNVMNLPPGPFQITPGIPYDAYAASPVHRYYQMWQQLDCSAATPTAGNPSGCKADLFPWVETTIGAGSNGNSAADRLLRTRVHERGFDRDGLLQRAAGRRALSEVSRGPLCA